MGPESVTLLFKFGLQFLKVVNLTVENDREPIGASKHRLVPTGQINDREPAHAKRNFVVYKCPLIVWSTMRDHAAHSIQHFIRRALIAMLISTNETGDATHLVLFLGVDYFWLVKFMRRHSRRSLQRGGGPANRFPSRKTLAAQETIKSNH
jgi:hypothetical protein